VKLVPVGKRPRKRSILGTGIGKIWISPDFDSPETNKEIEDLFYSDEEDHFYKSSK
jgi:hypothetical protein